MDAGTSRYKRPGQVGGPIGMPESMRSQMLSEMGQIDVSQQDQIGRAPAPQVPQHQHQHQHQYGYGISYGPQYPSQPARPQQQQYTMGGYHSPVPQMPPQMPQMAPRKPMPAPVPSSRRSSITSTSSRMNKFFKTPFRGRAEGVAPDDDDGQDFDMDDDIMFSDLQHIRDRGRYGLGSTASLETSAFIPTMASKPAGSSRQKPGKLSNTEYRRQVTAAKKLAYVQAANGVGSRSNTMQDDPRAMSLQSAPNFAGAVGMDPRTMSMTNPPQMRPANFSFTASGNPYYGLPPPQAGPRAMSLNGPVPRFGPGGAGPGGAVPQQLPPGARGSPYMQPQQPQAAQAPGRPGFGSNPRVNSFSQTSSSADSLKRSPLPGRTNGSFVNSTNTSQQSIPEKPQERETGLQPRADQPPADVPRDDAPHADAPQPDATPIERKPSRVLKRISFSSATPSRETNVDVSPEKSSKLIKTHNETSPLKSISSGYSVSSGEYPAKNQNNAHLYALSKNNTQATDVFVTASQFSLGNIEEESKPLAREETLKATDGSLKSETPSHANTLRNVSRSDASHSKSSSINSAASGQGKPKRRSFLKRISFGKSGTKSAVVEAPSSRAASSGQTNPLKQDDESTVFSDPDTSRSAVALDDFKYSQPTMGRAIRDFSFGSESEVLRMAPLYPADREDVASSVVSMENTEPATAAPQSQESARPQEAPLANTELKVPTQERAQRVSLVKIAPSQPPKEAAEVAVDHTREMPVEIPRLNFTVEQLGIMQSNTRLLQELEMVSNELAGSISREFELESKFERLQRGIKSPDYTSEPVNRDLQTRKQGEEISRLINELTEERKKRYIAEEHVVRWENGMTPSALDLNYAHSDMQKQLAKQNDVIKEYESKLEISTAENVELMNRLETVRKQNDYFKSTLVPNLENQVSLLENNQQMKQLEDKYAELKLKNEELRAQAEGAKSVEDQRQALRQTLKSMKESYERELKAANEKIRLLESHSLQSSVSSQKSRRGPLRFDHSHSSETDQSPMSTPTPARKILPVVFDD